MSTAGGGLASASSLHRPQSEFERQREELMRGIALGMENVLQNINRLNRNLESIITVGNEFSSVEALWSQFENFMGPPQDQGQDHDQEDMRDGEGVEGDDGRNDTRAGEQEDGNDHTPMRESR